MWIHKQTILDVNEIKKDLSWIVKLSWSKGKLAIQIELDVFLTLNKLFKVLEQI